jgi:hypothetical protein
MDGSFPGVNDFLTGSDVRGLFYRNIHSGNPLFLSERSPLRIVFAQKNPKGRG